ncbi:unnamed protein product [Ambrosiozyma monospora]|uniref:Unnamed protein product n=1 Tax=Ambrosiozyma monospora TaxID=43982 RepID=A0ACB5T5J2_AMBMO|nr:unnamed protein product [Ambrosiozyma monospora]
MDYLKFVAPLFENNNQLKKDYLDNKNIVEMRKIYMKAKGKTGLQLVQEEQSISLDELKDEVYESKFGGKKLNKYAIISVATIGCGKTTTALILQNLYPELVGHIQNDNLSNPVKDKLVKGALELFVDKQIVVLDKNNHQFRERKQIFDDFAKLNVVIPTDKLKFVCLNFVAGSGAPDEELWKVTKNRIIERGDNHQSIKAEGDGKMAESIMKGFISRFQPVNTKRHPDSDFDLVINLEVNANRSSLDNAKVIVKQLREFASDLQLPEPTEEQFQKAFDDALKYKPKITKTFKTSKSNKKKAKKPQYFGIDIPKEKFLASFTKLLQESNSPSANDFYNNLIANKRVQTEFHVTLIHSGSALSKNAPKKDRKTWNNYVNEYFREDLKLLNQTHQLNNDLKEKQCKLPSGFTATVGLKELCWDDRVMCVSVDLIGVKNGSGEAVDLPIGNKYLHITIGTAKHSVKAFESNKLLSNLYDFKDEGVHTIKFTKELLSDLPIFVHF